MLRSTNEAVIRLKNEYQESGNLITINKNNIRILKTSFFLNIGDTDFAKYLKFLKRGNLVGIKDGIIETIFYPDKETLLLVYFMGEPIIAPGTSFRPTPIMSRILAEKRPDLFVKDYLFKISKVRRDKNGKSVKVGFEGIVRAKNSLEARKKIDKYKGYLVEEITPKELIDMKQKALKELELAQKKYDDVVNMEKSIK